MTKASFPPYLDWMACECTLVTLGRNCQLSQFGDMRITPVLADGRRVNYGEIGNVLAKLIVLRDRTGDE